MNQKIDNEIGGWTDPDDAPELMQEWFDKAHYYRDGKLVKRGGGEPPFEELPSRDEAVVAVEIAYDEEVKRRFSGLYCSSYGMEAAVDALIARGWLRVKS